MARQTPRPAAWIAPVLFIMCFSKTGSSMCRGIQVSNTSGWEGGKFSRGFEPARRFVRARCAQAGRSALLDRHLQDRSRSAYHAYDDLFGTRKRNQKAHHGGGKRWSHLRWETAFWRQHLRFQIATATQQRRRQAESGLCWLRTNPRFNRGLSFTARPAVRTDSARA